nr:hypothetical protein [Tanacetum cinerariifolium]
MDSNESDEDHDMEEHRSTNEDIDPNAALDDFIQQNIVKESALKDSKKGDQANVSTHVADHDMEEHRLTNEDIDLNAALDDFIQQNIVKESALKDSKEGDQANVSTHVAGDNETLFSKNVKEEYFVTKEDKPLEEDVSDMSKPPGFENFIKQNSVCSISSNASRSGKCFTSFGNYKRKELKGFSFIDEMSRIIEVGGTLGYNVRGCKKSLWKMINGIDVSDMSKPPGFENFIKQNSVCSISSNASRSVRNDSERFGFIFSSGDAAIFNDFIQESGLIDLPMGALDRRWSNHNPILLHLKKIDFGPTPFRIFHLWFDRIDFEKVVKDKWDDITGEFLDIKEAFLNFYKKKFSCHDSQVYFPSFMPAHRLNTSDQDLLEAVVSMEEIKTTEFVVSFFYSGKFPQGVNSTFITLIPKVSNPLFIKDYRPISLIGLHYMIVAKILSNRLSKVIDSIISPEQSVFISGRQILDGPLILSEIIDWTSILINGSPTLEFSFKRGLRQGDPLSPFFFIIVMEGLYMALNDGKASNMFHGNQNDMENITRILNIFYIASGLKINFHKFNVFRVGVSNGDVVSTAACTGCEAGSFPFSYLGLPIGSNMSRIAYWQILIDRFKARLSGSFPFSYLGLPIGSNISRIAYWQILIDRFKARLSGWKANLLSIGVRLTLIKSVLGSLGIYYFSIFKAPEMVIKSLESLRANFFWGSHESSKKLSCVRWSNTVASFDKGGLGVGSLSAFNTALLLKWRCHLFNFLNFLWVQATRCVIIAKVLRIVTHQGWYYMICNKCKSKANKLQTSNSYKCERCDEEV